LEFKDRWEKYTPPTSMAAGIFVGTEPQLSGWSQSRSLIAAEGRAEVGLACSGESVNRDVRILLIAIALVLLPSSVIGQALVKIGCWLARLDHLSRSGLRNSLGLPALAREV
jgi:hypothetical protein